MSIPPPPDRRPPRRRPAPGAPPEDSLTTQLFVGQAKPTPPTEDTQVLGRDEIERLRRGGDPDAPGGESTRVLSLEELEQIAAETHDDRLDGPRAQPAAEAPRATAAHSAWAAQQAPANRWPGTAAQAAPSGPAVPPPPPVPPAVGGDHRAAGWGAGPQPAGPQFPGPAGPGGGAAAGAPSRKRSGLPGAAIAVIVIAALLVAGIIGYILFDALSGPGDGANEAQPAPPPVAEEPADPSTEPTAAPSTPADVRAFAAPSGNITCTIDAERARCVIASFDYEPPERPADCQVENWGGIVVADSEGAGFSCAEAPAPAAAEPLAYGESISAHGMTCTSERDGMSCTSDTTGRGFSLARAGADFTN
ncbi:DUF6636 domain-containing protein [Brevibacterium ihuae]|uniref:DUF6636 domain-containing protein n=1 Tax=Brevibacterium ihuae TaxID=1631743 RepID=UPI0011AFA676|nr:DUF6636 domain-containing protein [Brevibacterium ihuae]